MPYPSAGAVADGQVTGGREIMLVNALICDKNGRDGRSENRCFVFVGGARGAVWAGAEGCAVRAPKPRGLMIFIK